METKGGSIFLQQVGAKGGSIFAQEVGANIQTEPVEAMNLRREPATPLGGVDTEVFGECDLLLGVVAGRSFLPGYPTRV